MTTLASGQISLVDLNDSKQLQLYLSATQPKTQIYNPNNSSYTPDWTTSNPVITPQLFVAGTSTDIIANAKSVTWYVAGVQQTASDTNYTLGTNTLTILKNVLSSANTILYTCEVVYTDPDSGFDVTAKADLEFAKVSSGATGATGASGVNAITVVLSNSNSTLTADSSGNVSSYSQSTTDIHVYDGATELTYDGTGTANGTYKVTSAITNGTIVAGAISAKTGTPNYGTVAVASGMTTDTASITFTITGKSSSGASISQTQVQTFSKSKTGATGATGSTGATGASATSYWVVPSVSAIQKAISGTYTPTSVSINMMSQVGTGTPAFYGGRMIISESTDGSTYTAKYTSSANETVAKSYTPSAGIKTLKIDMYLAGGTTTLVDTQIIPIVSDGATGSTGSQGPTGATGANAVYAQVWTPSGNVVRNNSGTLTASINVYSGSTLVTPSAFKWYIQNPAATTTSLGDTDGGNGWELLTSTDTHGTTNYTTATITIPASAIPSVASFKCVATYNSIKYSDVCTVTDVSDPIQIVITGVNVFKNGQGTTTLTAHLYQAGTEIDSAGTAYTYTWALYDSNNNEITPVYTSVMTGKSVTIDARDVNVRGNLTCSIS